MKIDFFLRTPNFIFRISILLTNVVIGELIGARKNNLCMLDGTTLL